MLTINTILINARDRLERLQNERVQARQDVLAIILEQIDKRLENVELSTHTPRQGPWIVTLELGVVEIPASTLSIACSSGQTEQAMLNDLLTSSSRNQGTIDWALSITAREIPGSASPAEPAEFGRFKIAVCVDPDKFGLDVTLF